jgi:hypothetical protein
MTMMCKLEGATLKSLRTVSVTSKQVELYLGFTNYHRALIRNYANIAHLLYSITGKMAFVCGLEQQISFDQFKQALCTTPVLAFPNFADTFILDTATLNFAIGEELLQVQNEDSPVIIYQGVKFLFDVV